MKYPIWYIAAVAMFICACAPTKQLELDTARSENATLTKQLQTAEMQLVDLKSAVSEKEKSIAAEKERNQKMAMEKKECEEDLATIKKAYSSYKTKLDKMTSEVRAAFPKNLNEPNFSIVEEDGRLVITLPNKILYKSGSAEFDDRALEIIQRLSKVFRNNEGLQILVEGHTDDLPLKAGSPYKDNWDLSLARAVKIVRQLETYGVFPSRLTAAGRGYFAPKSTMATDEARALNRRTEIIIRPKISEFLKVIDSL